MISLYNSFAIANDLFDTVYVYAFIDINFLLIKNKFITQLHNNLTCQGMLFLAGSCQVLVGKISISLMFVTASVLKPSEPHY